MLLFFHPSGLCSSWLLLVIIFIFLCLFEPGKCQSSESSRINYLKLKLLHRRALSTPFHIEEAVDDDSTRLLSLFATISGNNTLKAPVVSGASLGSGQYLVDFRIGTPPQKLLLVADTGSDLVWVRCSACRDCRRHRPGSAFFPRHSASFAPNHCYSHACRLVAQPPHSRCNHTRLHSSCLYQYTYGDRSVSAGIFSRETATLNTSSGELIHLRNVDFGCGFRASGASLTGPRFAGANGVMGLGQGPISFASQVGSRFGNKFSYCLMDYTVSPPPTSFLLLGDAQQRNMALLQKNLSFTPLRSNPLSPTFYYVGIHRVSVDGAVLPIDPSVWAIDDFGNGGTVVDSGTTLSFFLDPAYTEMLRALEKKVHLPRLEIGVASLDLCLNTSAADGTATARLPRLTFHMVGGAVFSPPARNYFIEVAPGVKCLAMRRAEAGGSGFSVIGNLMQQGFLFMFDRERSRVGFSPAVCDAL
ncbi:unnamed protein product [Victoria cruziana]